MLRTSLTGYLLTLSVLLAAQNASIQDCLGAIPVCQRIYQEEQAPIGNGNIFDFDGADNCLLGESNSIWYTFTVNNSGQFGFLLTPNDLSQDYDWILFDMTNANCEDLFNDPSLVLSCNAAGKNECDGLTGANGESNFNAQGPNCGNFPPDNNGGFSSFNDLVEVTAGNTYALCILNFSAQSSQGYTIDFGLSSNIGIFDETPPELEQVIYPKSCNGQEIKIKFSEFIQCSTISEENFQLSGTGGPYTFDLSATNCVAGGNYSKEFQLVLTPWIPVDAEMELSLVVDGLSEALDLCGNPSLPGNLIFGGPTLTEPLDLGPDQTLCNNQSLTLSSELSGGYTWSDGSQGATLQVSESGIYWLDIETPCGPTSDTIQVTILNSGTPDQLLGPDTSICPNGTLILDPGLNGPAAYLWQDGSLSSSYTVSQPGIYSVIIVSECGVLNDEIIVEWADPIEVPLNEYSICQGESISLDLFAPGLSYLWEDGSTNPSFTVSQAGIYSVQISNACETVEQLVEVREKAGTLPEIELGNDTLLCPGEKLSLELSVNDATILWSDGSTGNSFIVDQAGSYTVLVSNECGEVQDQIEINYAEALQAELQDTSICEGESHIFDVSTERVDYLWQDGATTPTYQASEEGTYSVILSNTCEEMELSAELKIISASIPAMILGNDTSICPGESLLLSVYQPDFSLLWPDGSTGLNYLVEEAGSYSVLIQNQCVESTDEIQVEMSQSIELFLSDTVICPDEILSIDLSDIAGDFSWQDGSEASIYNIQAPGSYRVSIDNGCEELVRSFEVDPCDQCGVFVPNIFSPNGDGHNDLFRPHLACDISNFSLMIFDRWGGLVYETSLYEEAWNGNYNGNPVDNGVYIYVIQLELVENGQNRKLDLSGSITVSK